MKLHAKIPAMVLPLVVAPLLLLGTFAYRELNDDLRERVASESHRALALARGQFGAIVGVARGNLQLLQSNIVVAKYATTTDESERYGLLQAPLLDLFRAYQKAFPQYLQVRFLLPDGTVDAQQAAPGVHDVHESEADSPWFKRLAASADTDAAYASVVVDSEIGRPTLVIGAPIRRSDPTVDAHDAPPVLRGYLVIDVDLPELGATIASARIGRSGFLIATDGAGRVLFGHDRVGDPPALPRDVLAHPVDTDGDRHFHLDGTGDAMAAQLHVERVNDNLLLAVVSPDADLRALMFESALVSLGAVVLTILVTGGGLVSVLERMIVRPLGRLRAVAAEIGSGNWDAASGVTSSDEIGDLARSVEDMARNLKDADDRVRYLAYHDNLTGLPNRVMFRDYLSRTMSQAERAEQKLAILFIDIDGFKRINDTLGHQTGDLLLKEVAKRLTSQLRDQDMVITAHESGMPDGLLARLGGDEFIVLLTAVHDPHGPGSVARRFIKALGETIRLNDQDCHIGASIGVAIYPDDGADAGELIKNADIAMYHAKNLGKNAYQYFQSSMNAAVLERAALEAKLRAAIQGGQLSLHYQPQVDAGSHALVGLEALVRWNDPDAGAVSPGAFIPLAEETGLILPLGEWVIEEACRQARAWDVQGLRSVPVSINVSGVQFERQDVAAIVARAVSRHQLPRGRIEIEITESAIMRQPERAIAALKSLRESGVGVALDDFGTGYSSLSYLRRFPIDTVKIDRSFIVEIDRNQEDAEIVAAIVAMAHTLGLRVVVEGVETEAQLDVIAGKGCDVVQGFVFSRPRTADDVEALLLQASSRVVPLPSRDRRDAAA